MPVLFFLDNIQILLRIKVISNKYKYYLTTITFITALDHAVSMLNNKNWFWNEKLENLFYPLSSSLPLDIRQFT